MRALLAGIDALNRLVAALLAGLLGAICIVVFIQVLVRFILTNAGLNVPAAWTEELARFLLCWMIFLGAGYGCRRAQLMAIDFAVAKLPGLLGEAARLLALLLCLAFFLLLVDVGAEFAAFGRTESSPVMRLRMDAVYWAIPAGAALMIVNTLALLAEAWTRRVPLSRLQAAQAID